MSGGEYQDVKHVLMNYPDPVPLQKLLADAANWSGKKFIIDPSLDRSIQIFAKDKLSTKDAFNLLLASLETVGLRSIPFDGDIIRIVEAPSFATKV